MVQEEVHMHPMINPVPMAIGLLLAAIILSYGIYAGLSSLSTSKTNVVNNTLYPQMQTISVSAVANQEVTPDKAELVFSVQTQGSDPTQIQVQNDKYMNMIINAEKALGVPANQIKTTGYSLQKWTEYNDTLKTYMDKGYILTNQLSVTTYQTNQTGYILKAAVSNGANDVSSVSFSLSDALQNQVYNTLLGQAATQANAKAQAMASAASVSVKKLDSMSEGYQTISYQKTYSQSGGISVPSAAPAVVTPGMVTVSATVSAVYDIG